VVSGTTHDLPTSAGCWTGRATDEAGRATLTQDKGFQKRARGRLESVSGVADDAPVDQCLYGLYSELGRSSAAIVVVPLEDLQALVARPNVPGAGSAWPSFRIPVPWPPDEENRTATRLAQLMTTRRSRVADYRYPDESDRIPQQGIQPSSTGDWLDADRALIDAALRVRGGDVPRTAVDAGAGAGRLLPLLLDRVPFVVAVEPDPRRMRTAQGLDLPADRIQFVPETIASWATRATPAELVVCSHVMQHVQTGDRMGLLSALRGLTARHGVMLMTWSASGESAGRHVLSRHGGPVGPVTTVEVSSQLFDAAVLRGEDDALPVWHAGAGEVEELLRSTGFEIVEGGLYRHFTYELSEPGNARPTVRPAADCYAVAIPASST
jgi:hypothetical protein